MTHSISITTATTADAEALTALSVTTFRDAFAADNKQEDMDKYIAEEMTLTKISAELQDQENLFFLAYKSASVVGYAKVRGTKIPDELKGHTPLELERIYVLNEQHGTGVGAALLQHCIDYAIGERYDIIWLGVWEHNHKATTFYKRWGFERFGAHIFRLGNDEQTDILMKKWL